MLLNRFAIIGAMASFILALSTTTSYAQLQTNGPAGTDNIWLMSWNVENLFDAYHDEGKRDWFFLPKNTPGKKEACMKERKRYRQSCLNMDWTDEKVAMKIDQKVRLMDEIGGRPDVLAIQEIENEHMVVELQHALGYDKYIFYDAEDRRGIDVALLYNKDRLHLVHWTSRSPNSKDFDRPTRDILTAFFRVRATGDLLGVYVNHWPSQAAPAPKRVAVAQKLQEFIDHDVAYWGPRYHTVVLGDFNTVDSDYPHPHRDVILDPRWHNNLIDVLEMAKDRRALPIGFPLGTYFYWVKMMWNHLDKFFTSRNLTDGVGLDVILSSYNIHRTDLGTADFEYVDPHTQKGSVVTGVPIRYNHKATHPDDAGFSDHLPVSVMLRVQ